MDRKLQRHRADSLRQHGFLVIGTSRFLIRLQAVMSMVGLTFLL